MQVVVAKIASNENINAATSKIYGAEFEVTAIPVPGLELDASAAVLHSEFKKFDTFDPTNPARGVISLAGNRLPFTPKYTLSYGAQYTFDTAIGSITVRGDGQSKSQVYFDQFNAAINSERASTILNASIGWKDPDERLSVTGYVKNISNGLYKNGTFVGGGAVGWPINGRYDPPRTYGVRFGAKF
jgi:iron complex outermembrane receptor protein